MDKEELEWLAAKVDEVVEDLKAAKDESKSLAAEKKRLEQKLSSVEKQIRSIQKEGGRGSQLVAENKAYKKKWALMRSKVTSMLAKVEALQ